MQCSLTNVKVEITNIRIIKDSTANITINTVSPVELGFLFNIDCVVLEVLFVLGGAVTVFDIVAIEIVDTITLIAFVAFIVNDVFDL